MAPTRGDKRSKEVLKMRTIIGILAALLLAGYSARAGGAVSVKVVPAPLAGYTCFAIENSSGDAVGGNCVKE
jgi:hypothetical protein